MAEQLTQAQREKRKRDSGRAGYDPALTALSRGAPVMVYDGACNLCHGWVRFALKRDRAERLRFLAAQSPLGQEFLKRNRLPAQTFDSFYLVENAVILHKSTGFLSHGAVSALAMAVAGGVRGSADSSARSASTTGSRRTAIAGSAGASCAWSRTRRRPSGSSDRFHGAHPYYGRVGFGNHVSRTCARRGDECPASRCRRLFLAADRTTLYDAEKPRRTHRSASRDCAARAELDLVRIRADLGRQGRAVVRLDCLPAN